MYKNYLDFFYGLVEFYGESSIYDAQATSNKYRLAPSILKESPFQQAVEDCLEAKFSHLDNSLTTHYDEHCNFTSTTVASNDSLEINFTVRDFAYVSVLFIYFLAAKRFVSKKVHYSSIVNKVGLRKKDKERSKECIWRLIYYSCSSAWLYYSCFIKSQHGKQLLSQSESISGYSLNLDLEEYLICIIELSFYLHATYAILFEDVWKYDSPMMLFHHIVSMVTILTVYVVKIHKIGLTAIFLRDICDLMLEVAKIFMCFRIQHEKIVKSFDSLVKLCFTLFSFAFFINQLYYYPLFCIYHGLNFIKLYHLRSGLVTGMVTGCVILLALDLIWSVLIIRLLYRIYLTNEPLKDLREIEDEDDREQEKEGQRGKDKSSFDPAGETDGIKSMSSKWHVD